MRITMVKKRLANGDPCEKCAQTEEMLKRKGLWERIDEVVWAVEGEGDSPGAKIAARHGVKLAPFFLVDAGDGTETVVTSALRLAREHLASATEAPAPAAAPVPAATLDVEEAARRLADAEPFEILRFALERYGERCAIAFSGAEDIVLIDMATSLGLPFSVFTVDTGRLHGETYEFLDEIRRRYGVEIRVVLPDDAEVSDLITRKGANSFYQDGHWECCAVRRLRPLRRALEGFDAWVTGQRRDGRSPADLPVVQVDSSLRAWGDPLVRLRPLAGWSRVDVFDYIGRHGVPTYPLHKSGFVRVGCAPCTRARTGSSKEPDRWWWETQVDEPTAPDPGSGI